MKLYGHPMSTCTRKVMTVLAEKGEKYDFILVDLMKGEHKAPDHLARQPFGVVPSIDDGGFQLFESRAICRYLDETLTTGNRLTPATAKDRALMEQWISVEHSYFTPAAMKVITQAVFNPMMFGKPADEELLKAGREATTKAAVVLDAHLKGKDFLVAEQFTIADICYLPYIEYLFAGKQGDLITDHKHVASWWNRCSERASWMVASGKTVAA